MTNPIAPVELTPHAAVIEAWVNWDERPRDSWETNLLIDAVARYAAELAIPSNELRRRMAAARRAGLGHDAALDQVRDDLHHLNRKAAA